MKKETRNLILFFGATFTWTWACYAPIAIGHHSPYEMPWAILLIGGGMGPSLVGVAMVLLTFEKERRREFWRRSFSFWRIRLPWWAVILVIFPLLFAVSIAADLALGGATPGMSEFKSLLANPATLPLTVFISFLSGPWSEEFGWRGYALDPLLKRLRHLARESTPGKCFPRLHQWLQASQQRVHAHPYKAGARSSQSELQPGGGAELLHPASLSRHTQVVLSSP